MGVLFSSGVLYFITVWDQRMPDNISNNVHRNDRLSFIQEVLRHPLQIGSIIPSSRFLERRIVETAKVGSADMVIELGPGTGGTTRAILDAMPAHARLLSIEINPHFQSLVDNIEDDRLISHLGSACDLKDIISGYALDEPNAIISGIPFSTMSRSIGTRIIEAVSESLAGHGRFVAYQLSNRVSDLCEPFLGNGDAATEFLNIPPMHIFHWEKR